MDVNFKPYKTGMVTGEYPKCCAFDLDPPPFRLSRRDGPLGVAAGA